MTTVQANLDGLVGPTHNYAGLSLGNIASQAHALTVSNPQKAALEGLQKMKFLHDMGLAQMVMPPQLRPDRVTLQTLGFSHLADVPPHLLHQIYSASSMWTANAATISASADTADGKVHITPANLLNKFHRSIETKTTAYYLRQIFQGTNFVHHAPLPAHADFADEGAANHMRLCASHGESGVEIFVYGGKSKLYPARQTKQASEAVARSHHIKQVVVLQQNANAIDAGVFHNDVIAMSNERLFIYHENAYSDALPAELNAFTLIKITEKELPLADAVKTYFFNSQLVTLPDGTVMVVVPKECEQHPASKRAFEKLLNEGYLDKIHYIDVRESMKNGGGPACLRLRVELTAQERAAVHPGVWLNDKLYQQLCQWIKKYYRDRISADDLRDLTLADESFAAMAELSELIQIPMEAA